MFLDLKAIQLCHTAYKVGFAVYVHKYVCISKKIIVCPSFALRLEKILSICHSAFYFLGNRHIVLPFLVYISRNPSCTSEASPPALGKYSLTPKLINVSYKNGIRYSSSHTHCTLYFIFILLQNMYCIHIKQAMLEASFQTHI